MFSRRLVPALTSLVVVSGVLAILSCEIDAKPERTVKTEAKSSRPSKCCQAGFFLCPTGGERGCDCCGASVKGTLASYKNKEGKLKIDGLDEDVLFEVEKPDVDKALVTMIGKPGQFILKLKPYEYKLDDKNKPHGKSKLSHWFGTTYECENLGDDNGKMKDRTAEFIQGWKISATVQEVQTMLQGFVPQYDPERNEDKRP